MIVETLELKNIGKRFGATPVLRDIHATFSAGNIIAIEGPNGSGKSTLLSIMAVLTRPSHGQMLVNGRVLSYSDEAVRAQIGLVAHQPLLYPDLSALENLSLFARLYSVANPKVRIDQLVQELLLGPWKERPVRTYSRGQLQRVALARGLLHGPSLLLLDEPSTGLDQESLARLTPLVRNAAQNGAIVLFTSHDLAWTESLATSRMRLEKGTFFEAQS